MAEHCAHCGQTIKAPRAPKVQPQALGPVDTSGMSDAQLKAHYNLIAPAEDLRFLLARQLPPDLIHRAAAALQTIQAQGGKHTAATRAEYRDLLAACREYQLLRDRQIKAWANPDRAPVKEWPIYYQNRSGQYFQLAADGSYTAIGDRHPYPAIIRPLSGHGDNRHSEAA